MQYEVILKKGNYALINRGENLKEYAVVYGLDEKNKSWEHSCGAYDYEYNGNAIKNQAEMLMMALTEFREKTEENYEPAKLLDIYREDYSENTFQEVLECLNLNDDEVGSSFIVYATVDKKSLIRKKEKQVHTERGLIYVEAEYQSAESAIKDGYSYAFYSKELGQEVYSKCTDSKGLYHIFALIV